MKSLKQRIWSEITMLWENAVARHDWLPGHMLDSAIALTTDSLDDFEYDDRRARSMRKGVFGVACVQGGKFVGLSRYMGIKQKNMILVADEGSAMGEAFLSAVANLNSNENFRCVIMANPSDLMDPAGKASEPIGGWSENYLEPKKTTWWPTRFMGGVCVNLVGQDSPNFDFPPDQPTRYKYLISKEKIAETLSFFAEDSAEFYAMCKGVMKIGTVSRRVLTRDLCERFGAQQDAVWDDSVQTKVYFCDAAWGGDRAVGGSATFGRDVNGKTVLSYGEPRVIPVAIGIGKEPEDQLSEFIKSDCESQGIPPENMGHDSTGRGTLGTTLARIWSAKTNPIEAGGSPTERPVSLDLFIQDEKTGQKRLKRCNEEYDRRVSELNYQVRIAVEAGQVRNLPDEAMEELCARKWDRVRDNRMISIEPKSGTKLKPGYKERMGKSPDMGDWAAGILEMAFRRGFRISKNGIEPKGEPAKNWVRTAAKASATLRKGRTLTAA